MNISADHDADVTISRGGQHTAAAAVEAGLDCEGGVGQLDDLHLAPGHRPEHAVYQGCPDSRRVGGAAGQLATERGGGVSDEQHELRAEHRATRGFSPPAFPRVRGDTVGNKLLTDKHLAS